MPPSLIAPELARAILASSGPIVFLTGAGVSAESGVPTFRGPEGYWRVGSRNYQATDLATAEAFARMPDEVWRWYLYRRGVCRAAEPNAAHLALVEAERRFGERFLLVTQNVDGLHARAGNTAARTYRIHGDLDLCRCADGCAPAVRPMPAAIAVAWAKDRVLDDDARAALHCDCGAWLRPHVLWFDEAYDEPLFRYLSARRAAGAAAALVVIGTSGATNLPAQMCAIVAARAAPLIVVDPDPAAYGAVAGRGTRGVQIVGGACATVPPLVDALLAAA
ncbi:MAG TPA: Sir2 family NAD-dependent protein deacetylase [Polyangia bacterium]|nr:Sir2 family NAD-dependent protein deacetylase [Polyangia bacterium]